METHTGIRIPGLVWERRVGQESFIRTVTLTTRDGPVDQWKIACFASRRPWVQIPAGPLPSASRMIVCRPSTSARSST